MSRGLGEVQNNILEVLRKEPNRAWEVHELIMTLFYPDIKPVENGYFRNFLGPTPYTHSQFVSVHRAITSLEKRGFITSRIHNAKRFVPWVPLPLGTTKWKSIKLSVDRVQ